MSKTFEEIKFTYFTDLNSISKHRYSDLITNSRYFYDEHEPSQLLKYTTESPKTDHFIGIKTNNDVINLNDKIDIIASILNVPSHIVKSLNNKSNESFYSPISETFISENFYFKPESQTVDLSQFVFEFEEYILNVNNQIDPKFQFDIKRSVVLQIKNFAQQVIINSKFIVQEFIDKLRGFIIHLDINNDSFSNIFNAVINQIIKLVSKVPMLKGILMGVKIVSEFDNLDKSNFLSETLDKLENQFKEIGVQAGNENQYMYKTLPGGPAKELNLESMTIVVGILESYIGLEFIKKNVKTYVEENLLSIILTYCENVVNPINFIPRTFDSNPDNFSSIFHYSLDYNRLTLLQNEELLTDWKLSTLYSKAKNKISTENKIYSYFKNNYMYFNLFKSKEYSVQFSSQSSTIIPFDYYLDVIFVKRNKYIINLIFQNTPRNIKSFKNILNKSRFDLDKNTTIFNKNFSKFEKEKEIDYNNIRKSSNTSSYLNPVNESNYIISQPSQQDDVFYLKFPIIDEEHLLKKVKRSDYTREQIGDYWKNTLGKEVNLEFWHFLDVIDKLASYLLFDVADLHNRPPSPYKFSGNN